MHKSAQHTGTAVLQELIELTQTVLDVDAVVVSLVDDDLLDLPDPPDRRPETDLARRLCDDVAAAGMTLQVSDRATIDLTHGPTDGELDIAAYLGCPLASPTGEIVGATCAVSAEPRAWTARDVELLERISRTIVEVLAATSASTSTSAAKNEIAMVVHDLRSPLTVLVGASRRLLSADDPAEMRDQFAAMVETSARQLEELVEDLLVGASPRDERQPLLRQPVDVTELLHQLARQSAVTRGAEVSVRADRPVTVYTDGRALRRIVQNLLDNAFRHGEAPYAMAISTSPAEVTLSVTNHGRSIDAATRATLFGLFQPGTASSSSTGLGLHIVRRLVDALGGTVRLHDGDGPTVFEVVLPQRSAV